MKVTYYDLSFAAHTMCCIETDNGVTFTATGPARKDAFDKAFNLLLKHKGDKNET